MKTAEREGMSQVSVERRLLSIGLAKHLTSFVYFSPSRCWLWIEGSGRVSRTYQRFLSAWPTCSARINCIPTVCNIRPLIDCPLKYKSESQGKVNTTKA